MVDFLKNSRQLMGVFGALTILTGLIYPLTVTLIAQLCFPYKANGSLIIKDGIVRGSYLIGQRFESNQYFWGRPSVTPNFPYNAMSSHASNLAPSNPLFVNEVKNRITKIALTNPKQSLWYPIDLVTASGSGLDPEISPLAAFYQIPRVAKARTMQVNDLERLVAQYTQYKTLFILGEARINVVVLNLALDRMQREKI